MVIDASGLPILKRGNYIEDKWKKERREYLKSHIMVNIKSNRESHSESAKGSIHDTRKYVPMI